LSASRLVEIPSDRAEVPFLDRGVEHRGRRRADRVAPDPVVVKRAVPADQRLRLVHHSSSVVIASVSLRTEPVVSTALAAGETLATAEPANSSDLDGAMARVLHARDTSQMVAALRALAPPAEPLAAALEGDG
jgi:hypothetical protein